MTTDFDGDEQKLRGNALSADPVTVALRNAPLDDEPYTDEQRLNDALAEAAIANGEGIPQEELLKELGV